MRYVLGFIVAGLLIVGVGYYIFFDTKPDDKGASLLQSTEQAFQRFQLQTDTSQTSIDLDLVLSGGPGKDGIPAINNPSFVSVDAADVHGETLGVLVSVDGEHRFYPYNVLVWHEIVNDSINAVEYAVTFCPLCGSAIVFDRKVDEETLVFGVSGLLYESNLLMYDTATESLWSQAGAEAVVGAYTGTPLRILDMRLLEFGRLKESYPDARVLSRETGYARNYDTNPYSGYEQSDEFYFPVSSSDARFPPKEVFYIVPFRGYSVAFPQNALTTSTLAFQGTELTAEKTPDGIRVTQNGVVVPGYYEMWFSWVTHHEDDGVVWDVTQPYVEYTDTPSSNPM